MNVCFLSRLKEKLVLKFIAKIRMCMSVGLASSTLIKLEGVNR